MYNLYYSLLKLYLEGGNHFGGNMLLTVFRSRLRSENQEEYLAWATRMSSLVIEIPDYVSHKGFVSADGERVTIVEFSSEEGMKAWATHPQHLEAKKKGRESFFSEYRVQICNVLRDSAERNR